MNREEKLRQRKLKLKENIDKIREDFYFEDVINRYEEEKNIEKKTLEYNKFINELQNKSKRKNKIKNKINKIENDIINFEQKINEIQETDKIEEIDEKKSDIDDYFVDVSNIKNLNRNM